VVVDGANILMNDALDLSLDAMERLLDACRAAIARNTIRTDRRRSVSSRSIVPREAAIEARDDRRTISIRTGRLPMRFEHTSARPGKR